MVSAIYVLEQAKDEGLFDIEDRHTKKLNFSISIRRYRVPSIWNTLVSVLRGRVTTPSRTRYPVNGWKSFGRCLSGSMAPRKDGVRPVVQSQNPDIKRLGEVLAHAQGRHLLETTRNLDAAHVSTEPVDRQFTASLIRARDNIRDAAGSLRAYDGRDQSLLDIAEDVKESAEAVHARMLKKRREAGDVE